MEPTAWAFQFKYLVAISGMSNTYQYAGPELEIFELARNWKKYIAQAMSPHLRGSVLEAGAGIGSVTMSVLGPESELAVNVSSWVSLEPDCSQVSRIKGLIDDGALPAFCQVRTGTLENISNDSSFDTILYIDVLEHIEDDAGELARAASLLSSGGRLVVMSPAHNFLFSPLDTAAEHYRRYNRPQLRAIGPASTRLLSCRYLDSVGMAASLANKMFCRQALPTPSQIALWDGFMVRISRIVDPLSGYNLGKSILAIWEKV